MHHRELDDLREFGGARAQESREPVAAQIGQLTGEHGIARTQVTDVASCVRLSDTLELVDREAVIDKLVYTASNPVQDQLVDRVHHWPGVNGLRALLAGQPLRATRPQHFFRPDGPMPDALELPLTIPTVLGPAAAVLSELRDRVRAVEFERAAERERTGRRVLGRRAVRAQSWRDYPASVEPRRNLRPRVASRNKWARIEALLRDRAFAVEYASARDRWQNGVPAVFPPGTYWLQRFASVSVLET